MNHYTRINGLYAAKRGDCNGIVKEKKAGVVEIGNSNRILKANIPIGGKGQTVELIGRSWAADTTAFAVPFLRIALDAGSIVQGKKMNNVFITHCHADHCHYMTHLESITKPPHFFVPSEMIHKANKFLRAATQLTCNVSLEEYTSEEFPRSYILEGVSAGDRIVFDKKQLLVCHVVHCDHSVPTVGYCFSRIKHVLKPEFDDLTNVEIGDLRKEGTEVTEEKEDPLFCFLGDTSTSILEPDHPSACQIFRYPTIIIECTFLTKDFRDNAQRTQHVLWDDLKPHVLAHPKTTFILIHFSHRYHVDEVRDFFDRENLPNVIPWIPDDPHLYCHENMKGDEREVEEVWSHI